MRIEDFINYLNEYSGKSIKTLCHLFNIQSKAKNLNNLIVRKILDSYKGRNIWVSFFEANNIIIKTINLNIKGMPEESMSFPAFDFKGILEENWENSICRETFKSTFVFAIFKRENKDNFFLKCFQWKMPIHDLDCEVKKVWDRTKDVLKSGNVVKKVSDKITLNFPKESENSVCHVRPHGRNSLDIKELPKKDCLTNFIFVPKYSFWLNKKYLFKVIQYMVGV